MATVIRFARHGTKKKPFYRIVVKDKAAPRDGRFIENIGTYDPIKGSKTLTVKRERLEYWLAAGAIMSTTVGNHLKSKKKEWLGAGAPTVAATIKEPVQVKTPKATKTTPKTTKATKSKEA